MATRLQLHPARRGHAPQPLARLVDRWIFVGTAALFLAVVLIGFVPDSLTKLAAVRSGQRPAFPVILHLHAALMGLWIVLLLVQTVLLAKRQPAMHRRLGLVAAGVAPLLVVATAILLPTLVRLNVETIRHGPPAMAGPLQAGLATSVNLLLTGYAALVRFSILIALALRWRRRDGAAHKRLMVLGTGLLLGAATSRIPVLATTLPDSPLSILVWPLVLLAPLALWDLYRGRAVGRAYRIVLPVWLVTAVPVLLLWNTPGWQGFVLGVVAGFGPET